MSLFNQNFLTWSNPSINRALPIGGWVELGRTTLGADGDLLTVSGLPDKRYYMVLSHFTPNGTTGSAFTCNNDTSTNYARRNSDNDGAESTGTSQANIAGSANSQDNFNVSYYSNLSSKEKLVIAHNVDSGGSGATVIPNRRELVGKWDNTSDAISRFDMRNFSAGSYTAPTEVVVLGWDPADTHTNNFWQELVSIDGSASNTIDTGAFTAKKYLWVQYYSDSAVQNGGMQFNSDTGANYAHRSSFNGGADATGTSLAYAQTASNSPYFVNAFIINNSANEKLIISHNIRTDTGAGASNAPAREEFVSKWTNTASQITSIQFMQPSTTVNFSTTAKFRVWGSD